MFIPPPLQTNLMVYWFPSVCVSLSVCVSVCPSVRLYACLSVSLSACLSVCRLSVYMILLTHVLWMFTHYSLSEGVHLKFSYLIG